MGQFVVLAFIVIMLISWVINQVNAQNQRKPPPQRRGPQRGGPPRRNRGIQDEIDNFLREAAGRRQPPRGGGRVLEADEIEIVEERPAPRRPAPARPTRQPKPGTGVAGRHLGGQERLGSSVRDHLRTHMEERVEEQAEGYLPHAVDQLVAQHLGAFSADSSGSSGRTAQSETRRRARIRAAALRTAFRTPGGARNAVLMHEILSRPRSLRGRKR